LRFVGVSGVSDIGIYLYASKATVMKGTIIKGAWNRPIRALDITVDKYLINPSIEDWTISWGGTSTAKIYRQYELDLKVIDNTSADLSREIVGAVVNINSTSTDTLCFNNRTTTNSTGQIDTQTITKGYYNETGDDTIYSCEPYRFIIIKPGYQTLNFTSNITDKTDWTLAMEEEISDPHAKQWINVSGYNTTHITYNLLVQLFNPLSYTSDFNVTPDSSWGSTYNILSLASNTSNITTFQKTYERNETDENTTIAAPVVNNTWTGNSILLPIPNKYRTCPVCGVWFAGIADVDKMDYDVDCEPETYLGGDLKCNVFSYNPFNYNNTIKLNYYIEGSLKIHYEEYEVPSKSVLTQVYYVHISDLPTYQPEQRTMPEYSNVVFNFSDDYVMDSEKESFRIVDFWSKIFDMIKKNWAMYVVYGVIIFAICGVIITVSLKWIELNKRRKKKEEIIEFVEA